MDIIFNLQHENHLLDALSQTERQHWMRQLEWVEMPLGQVLYESGRAIENVYFPVTAAVSLQYLAEDGTSVEFAGVGSEGMVGIASIMGSNSTPSRAVVESAGRGYRMKAQAIKDEFSRSHPVMLLLLRYAYTLMTQMAQTAVCNRQHTLDQQLCRWLLSYIDRLGDGEILMTQERIAGMLGVRREGVTEAALKLQRAGLISYQRGHIRVLDRAGLEKRSCRCYAVVKTEFDRLLPHRLAA